MKPICGITAETINLWGNTPAVELPWGLTLDAYSLQFVMALTIDLNRSLRGEALNTAWRGVKKDRLITTIVEEITLIILITINHLPKPEPPLCWMLTHRNWQAALHYTPAMLSITLATGILILAALLLSVHQSPSVLGAWKPAGFYAAVEPFTADSWVMWLDPTVQAWGRELITASPGR